MKRVFLIVLDSVGIGCMPDAEEYGDEGCNTLKSVVNSKKLNIPMLCKMGLFNIDGIDFAKQFKYPIASYARLAESSKGKDTIIGHWEICGLESDRPLPTYPDGFPQNIIDKFEQRIGRKVLCNKPFSGTEVINSYGELHMRTGDLIVYTSADSVFQIAAHEEIVPLEQLYNYCEIARKIMQGKHAVGRIIARPFKGEYPNFYRTANRKDFSLEPSSETLLDLLKNAGLQVISVGKIYDIFAGRGITEKYKSKDNNEGMDITIQLAKSNFTGMCFVNLVDFDMKYGHRNDIDGYANALSEFDIKLIELLDCLKADDILIITADHGCDPGYPGTDHTREYTPMLIFGEKIKKGINLGTREGFSDIGATIADTFGITYNLKGRSFFAQVINPMDPKDNKKRYETSTIKCL